MAGVKKRLGGYDEVVGDEPIITRVATRVFDEKIKEASDEIIKEIRTEIKQELKEQRDLSFAIIKGAVAVAILFVLGIIVQAWIFMASYNNHYLETRADFSNQINELRKESLELKGGLMREVDKTADKQEYLERNILNKIPTK